MECFYIFIAVISEIRLFNWSPVGPYYSALTYCSHHSWLTRLMPRYFVLNTLVISAVLVSRHSCNVNELQRRSALKDQELNESRTLECDLTITFADPAEITIHYAFSKTYKKRFKVNK